MPPPPDPKEEARTFLEYLQEQPGLVGKWIAYQDLANLYAGPLSWGSVHRAFGRMTKSRRRGVVQYYIPRPRKEKAPE